MIVTKSALESRARTSGDSGRGFCGHARSPDSGYEQLCPCHIRRVFVAECLEHHPFLCTDTKCEENSKRHEVQRPYNPVRKHERLADGVEEERCVHWMTDIAVDPLRHESMVLAQFKGDRPVRALGPSVTGGTTRGPQQGTGLQRRTARDVSEYSANEKTGDTTQINGTRNPIHARVSRATSRGPLQLRATLTPRLRRP